MFRRKIGIFQREIWNYLRTESSVVTKKFSVSSAWMASYSVCKVSEKYQVRNFGLPGSVKRLDGFMLCKQG